MKIFFAKYTQEYKATIRLALPVALSQIGYTAVNFADSAMVGIFGGADAVPLSAVSFAATTSYIFFLSGIAITIGLTPIIGEIFAQGNRHGSAKFLQSAILLYPLIGLLFMALQIASEPYLYYLGQPKEVIDTALPYYRLIAYSIPAAMLFGAFKQFLEGIGNTKVAMYIALAINAINIFLNWALIFGHCGFQPMGAVGAGIATLIARILEAVFVIICFLCKGEFREYFSLFERDNEWASRWLKLIKIGLPLSGQMVLEASAWVVTGIMMGWFGALAIGANQVGNTYGNSTFMLILSLSAATTIRVSHGFGRRNIGEIRTAMWAALHLASVWSIITTTCFIVFRRVLPLAFSTNTELIELASDMLILYGSYQIFDTMQSILLGVLRGVQDVRSVAVISFIAYILLNIPIGYVSAFTLGLGAKGLLIGYIFGLFTAMLLYTIRLRKTLRRLAENGFTN